MNSATPTRTKTDGASRSRRRIPKAKSGSGRSAVTEGRENREDQSAAQRRPGVDAFILNTHGISVICGPVGSGKTIASVKKGLVEAQRIYPGADGVRNYKLGNVPQKYDNQWKATIPSHWKIFRKDLAGSKWSGASPRQAQHICEFEDVRRDPHDQGFPLASAKRPTRRICAAWNIPTSS
jgi:hypothetical protein